MRHLDLQPLRLNSWRKIALGTWNTAGDPSVYGIIDIHAEKILERQNKWQQNKQNKAPTITAIVAKAIAEVLRQYPQINGMIRWGKIYNRKSVTVFLQTAVDDAGAELSGLTICNAETKSLNEIATEIKEKAAAVRKNQDPTFKKTKSLFNLIPAFFIKWLLSFSSFLMYTLNLDPKFLGMPKDPFGSVMITSVGMLGLDEGFAPLVPYSRVPLLLAICATKDQAVVIDGKVEIVKIFKICGTFDHRFIDGVYASKMIKLLRHLLETDEGLDRIGLF